VTAGTLAHPLVDDDNRGHQVAGRLTVTPTVGLTIGTSASRGPFAATEAVAAATGTDSLEFAQSAWGADVEYSRSYYVLRAEAVVSRWSVPVISSPAIDGPLQSTGLSVEGKYKIAPGLYAAARLDRLGFSTISGSTRVAGWDAPVTRFEIGGGYSLQRNLLLKLSYQHNSRETNYVPNAHLAAAEVLFWF
jgi:hypothetical protein